MIPIVLSAVAVLLSGATFWWNTQRRGHLHIYEAPTYELTVNEAQVAFCLLSPASLMGPPQRQCDGTTSGVSASAS